MKRAGIGRLTAIVAVGLSVALAAPSAGAAAKKTTKKKTAKAATTKKGAASTEAPAATAAPATTAAPAAAKSGGKMVFAVEAETAAWLPSATQWAMSGNFIRQTMIENLIMPNSKGLPECLLCESFSANAKYNQWTIKIRQGIKFHNGEALDADAVKLNFDELRKNGAVTGALLRPITSVDVLDPSTVRINLSSPFINFAAILENQRSAMLAPAQIKAQDRNNPIGTGPYMFKEWKVNDSLTVVKNPSYWRKDAQPALDQITFKVITEETARVTAFKAGDIQGMMTVNPIKIAELKKFTADKKGTVIEINKNPGINNILFNLDKWPTSDVRVRQALALATDRNALNEINNAGILKIIDVPFVPGDSSKLTGVYPKPDMDKAKALIDKVEKETGKKVELTLYTSAVPENIESAQTLQQMWQKAGATVKVAATEQAAYVRQIQTGDFQAGTFRFQSALDPEDTRALFHSENYQPVGTVSSNYMRWKSAIVDGAMEVLRVNSDPAVRRKAADTIANELVQDWPLIITSATTWGVALNGDYKVSPATLPSGSELQTSPTGAFWLNTVSKA